MKHFNLLNTIFGWLAFLIAAATYLLTIEPTASFWDCGEFISTAYKLDVGHPPGAPFFMLTGKFFSLFASDPAKVAMMINAMSAILSALTILFLFWTITHLAKKIIIKNENSYTTANIIAILGAGMLGALAYTFSDTFWFSAVEGEVYAYSSFFTALVFWLILKWDEKANEAGSDRWLILIAYFIGLSIGVHLLNLLAIPAIVLVYYFKKYTPSAKGIVVAIVCSGLILIFVLYGLVGGSVEVAGWFELLFVNKFGLSFNSGLLFYIILVIASLVWALYETTSDKSYVRMAVSFVLAFALAGVPFVRGYVWVGIVVILTLATLLYFKRKQISTRWLHTTIVMLTVVLVGYSSYTLIIVRSQANPPMDLNSVDNVFALKYYLNREQYGETPLLYGPVYTAQPKYNPEGKYCVREIKKGKANYAPKPKENPDEKDQYIITDYKERAVTHEAFNMFFPRMYYNSVAPPSHAEAYRQWGRVKGEKVTFENCEHRETATKPTFAENMRFFFDYQIGFMYWRYFMWNFSGRQNDVQGHGEIENGNWISGLNFIDKHRIGDRKTLPAGMTENKGHNRYYMLPLLLGIIGMVFQLSGGKQGKQGFWITLLLFVLTGIAIVVYLNQSPYQVRERDYAYAGSFYAFSIWIGLGVLGIIKLLNKHIPQKAGSIIAVAACLCVPFLMATENWDDHDRSGRYVARDMGLNYLETCEPNAIIFTMGDNDTYPLWYNQETEENRTDVRVCNLSFLTANWYIDQMKRQAYKSAPLPIAWQPKDYITGKNDFIEVTDLIKQPIDINLVYNELILNEDTAVKCIPSKQIFIPVDENKVRRSPIADDVQTEEIVSKMEISLEDKHYLNKSELMVLELLRNNEWERPVYFAKTVPDEYYLGLDNYLHLNGLAYQLLPTISDPKTNTEKLYDNLMNKYSYGNMNDPKVYLDETNRRSAYTLRELFVQLIDSLIQNEDYERATYALNYCNEMIPATALPYSNYIDIFLTNFHYLLQNEEKGDEIASAIADNSIGYLNWYLNLKPAWRKSVQNQIISKMNTLGNVLQLCSEYERKNVVEKYYNDYAIFAKALNFQ